MVKSELTLFFIIFKKIGIPDDKELGPDAKRQKSEKELTMPYIPGSGITPGQIQGVPGMPIALPGVAPPSINVVPSNPVPIPIPQLPPNQAWVNPPTFTPGVPNYGFRPQPGAIPVAVTPLPFVPLNPPQQIPSIPQPPPTFQTSSSSNNSSTPVQPLFPAYMPPQPEPPPVKVTAPVETTIQGINQILIFTEDNTSMEEIRAQSSKYLTIR